LLRGARLIRMYEMLPNPCRVAVISVPKKLDQRTAEVLGTTAEWIMERPSVPGSDQRYPLPDYGTIEFADCVVRSRHPPAAARRQLLRGAGLIRMYEMLPNPCRAAVISVPKKLDQRTAEVRSQQR
jgi:hypothetical protein